MGDGLFEIRAKAQEGIGRSLYCYMKGHHIVILHAFIKKTQKTPKQDLSLAKLRKAACRLFLRNLPGHPSPRQGQKQATSMPPAALAVLVPLDFDPPSGLKIYAPQ